MKVLVIYFSQTGATEKIAGMIQKGILSDGNECEIVRMQDAKGKNLGYFDIIGLGCPTFFYREPVNVKNFIRRMDKQEGKHCFIFCTHGSIMGNTLFYLQEELSRRGFEVIGSFDSYSKSSIQFYPEVMHTTGHPDAIELDEAEKFGAGIGNLSLRVGKGELKIPRFELIEDTWWARSSRMLTLETLRKFSPVLRINTERCTKCLECQENCPANAIDIEADPPAIQMEGCIFCWYCEKLCPVEAIEADWSGPRESSRSNLKKYIRILREAEREGKFRPYVDYEKIE
jgi:flavodoxin/Pyruvate/2-oxoacid:ferredoxin oxidoreductase delta subunit